jgi:hypothetical protein
MENKLNWTDQEVLVMLNRFFAESEDNLSFWDKIPDWFVEYKNKLKKNEYLG